MKIKENDIFKIRIDGHVKAVRVIDLCADSALVELRKSGQCLVCQVSELKPILDGTARLRHDRARG